MFQIYRMSSYVGCHITYHKSSAQLRRQELVEQLQHFKTSMFHTVVQRGLREMARSVAFIL